MALKVPVFVKLMMLVNIFKAMSTFRLFLQEKSKIIFDKYRIINLAISCTNIDVSRREVEN